MKRIVYDSGYVSPPGEMELLEIYPTQHELDAANAYDELPRTYAEMWEETLKEKKDETS